MRSLLEHAARARALVENNAHLEDATRQSLRALVEFVVAACPPAVDRIEPSKSPHTLYQHPNNRCCITIEPNDLRTPYYEWRRVYGSWALYNRHCWRDDAIRIASGPIKNTEDRKGPNSSRPPTPPAPPAPPSVEIMPLEEQIRQLLLVEKDRGEFIGTTASAVRCLEEAGFDLDSQDVRDALWYVTRGASYRMPEIALPLLNPAAVKTG
jgi:hypothetical protein